MFGPVFGQIIAPVVSDNEILHTDKNDSAEIEGLRPLRRSTRTASVNPPSSNTQNVTSKVLSGKHVDGSTERQAKPVKKVGRKPKIVRAPIVADSPPKLLHNPRTTQTALRAMDPITVDQGVGGPSDTSLGLENRPTLMKCLTPHRMRWTMRWTAMVMIRLCC